MDRQHQAGRNGRIRRTAAALLTLCLATAGVLVSAPPERAVAVPSAGGASPVGKERDVPSFHDYPGVQANEGEEVYNHSTDPGRIWTDKTVFMSDGDLAGQGESPLTVDDDELEVVLSALGSTRQIQSTRTSAIDLVVVLDNSYSMNQCVGSSAYCNTASTYRNSRAYAMVQGVNTAIEALAEADPNLRVGLASFGSQSEVLAPLSAPVPAGGAGTGSYLKFVAPTGGSAQLQIRVGDPTATFTVGGPGTQSTNTQRGIATGMGMLAAQSTAEVAGDFQRVPSVIVFSDGEPTLSAASTSWWSPGASGTNQGPQVPGTNQYYGNGFLAAMTASFLKNRITDVYNDEDYNVAHGVDAVAARVFTVGLGVEALTENGRQLAYATLDPSGHYGDASHQMYRDLTSGFNAYLTGSSVSVPVSGSLQGGSPSPNRYFTVTHPTGAQDLADDVTDIRYNDSFDDAASADELVEVFQKIAGDVVDHAPVLPVETETGDPNADGYVTFTDQLGAFMRVTGVDRIAYCALLPADPDQTECDPVEFEDPTTSSNGGVTRYTFHGSFQANDLFDATDVSNIVITVQTSPSLVVGDIVTVRIPVALLPMRDTRVTEDPDGTPTRMTWFASHPVHIYYGTAPKAGVAAAIGDPARLDSTGAPGDGTALADYIAANTVDGQVRFYSNAFTGSGDSATATTTATFQPSDQNDFYRFAREAVIYSDSAGTQPLTRAQWDALPGDATIYRRIVEYTLVDPDDATSVTKTERAVGGTKAELIAGQHDGLEVHEKDGRIVAPAGLYNMAARIHDLDIAKCGTDEGGPGDDLWANDDIAWAGNSPVCTQASPTGNLTGTDPGNRVTTVTPGAAQPVSTRLGNNGWVSYAVPGSLVIGKRVDHANGLAPDPEEAFTVSVSLTGADGAGPFEYTVRAPDGSPVEGAGGALTGSGGEITLKAGQDAQITGLPDGAVYSVSEPDQPPGYTQTSLVYSDAAQTIAAGDVDRADLVNTYEATPVTISDEPSARKELEPWPESYVFTFDMCPLADAPVPAGGDPTTGCLTSTISGQNTDETPSFAGSAEFTAPGVYSYTITERDQGLAGIASSQAEYLWTVTVTDTGEGALAASSATTRVADDGGEAVSEPHDLPATFTNAFSAGPAIRTLQAQKWVDDESLGPPNQLRPPAAVHDFVFAVVDPANQTGAPRFGGDQDTATVTNAIGSTSVTSPDLTFTAEDAGGAGVYYYLSYEDPDGAVVDEDTVTRDDAVWFYRVAVDARGEGEAAVVETSTTYCLTTLDAVAATAPWGACAPDTSQTGDGYSALADLGADPDYGPFSGSPRFVNNYDPDPVDAVLAATKALSGRAWTEADTFDLTLAAGDGATEQAIDAGWVTGVDWGSGETAQARVTASAPGEGNASFGPLTFTRQGSYSFRIAEQAPASAQTGMTYDTHALIYDVTVSEVPDSPDDDTVPDGDLDVAVSARTGDGSRTFVNRYTATVVYQGATLTKTMAGRDLRAGEFTFTDTAVDATDLPGGATAEQARAKANFDTTQYALVNPEGAPDGAASVAARQQPIAFTQDDIGITYRYELAETPGALGGVTYDGTLYTAELTALHDDATGDLYVRTRVVSSDPGDPGFPRIWDSRDPSVPQIGFTNRYAAGPGQASLSFTKVLSGIGWDDDLVAGGFDFTLTPIDAAGEPLPGGQVLTTAVGPGSPVADGVEDGRTGAFPAVSFNEPGTYRYRIAEVVPRSPIPGMTYSTQQVDVTVTVSDDGSGALATRVDGDRPARFDNYYRYDWQYELVKTLTGRDMAAGEFQWQVQAADQASADFAGIPADPALPADYCVTQACAWDIPASADGVPLVWEAKGQVLFSEEELSGQTYCYFYSEVIPEAPEPGIVYDRTVYELCSTVSRADGVNTVVTVGTGRIDGEEVSRRTWTTRSDDVPLVYPRVSWDNVYVPWNLEKTSDPSSGSPVAPGQTITYTLTARNESGAQTLSGASAVDDLSGVLDHAELAAPLSEGLTLDGSTLTWSIPDLGPGERVSVSYRVTIDADARGATLGNVAAPGDPSGACVSCETQHRTPPEPESPGPGSPGTTPPPSPSPSGGAPTGPNASSAPPRGGLTSTGAGPGLLLSGVAAILAAMAGAGLLLSARRRE
ncbi:MAG: DUF5979 domain-containing protein [Actinomyces sp.]|jgi:pilin isopeptide linkage protein|nr:FctA domain-containing protein [Actinomyces sp.]MCI1662145.1 DUF5979 domain-containing protein [Actinomyces sp.]